MCNLPNLQAPDLKELPKVKKQPKLFDFEMYACELSVNAWAIMDLGAQAEPKPTSIFIVS